MTSTRSFVRQTPVPVSLVAVASLIIPPLFSTILDVATPRFSPEQFNLPLTARELVSKRTDKTATFKVDDGKFAQVAGIGRGIEPICQSKLCSLMQPIRDFLPSVFADSEGPNSPGTTGGNWHDTDHAKVSDTNYAYSDSEATNLDVRLIIEGSLSGDVKNGNVPTPEAYISYGGASDVWGATLTALLVNASNFGVGVYDGSSVLMELTNFSFSIPADSTIDGILTEIQAKMSYNSGPGDDTPHINHVRITVYYTADAAPVPFFSWWSVPLLIAGLFMILEKEGMLTHHLISPWKK